MCAAVQSSHTCIGVTFLFMFIFKEIFSRACLLCTMHLKKDDSHWSLHSLSSRREPNSKPGHYKSMKNNMTLAHLINPLWKSSTLGFLCWVFLISRSKWKKSMQMSQLAVFAVIALLDPSSWLIQGVYGLTSFWMSHLSYQSSHSHRPHPGSCILTNSSKSGSFLILWLWCWLTVWCWIYHISSLHFNFCF